MNIRNYNGTTIESNAKLAAMLADLLNNSNFTHLQDSERNDQNDIVFRDNASFWNEVRLNNLYINQYVKFENVSASEWIPQSPGLFHTREAFHSRMNAEHFMVRQEDMFRHLMSENRNIKEVTPTDGDLSYQILNELRPNGKASMIRGGIGCVRLEPKILKNQEVIILSITSTNAIHEGVPLICESGLHQKIIHFLKEPGNHKFSVVGKVVVMPKEVRLVNYGDSIPRYCIWAEKITHIEESNNKDLELTVSISFLNNYNEILYSFVSLEEKNTSQFNWGINWLKEYAINYSSSTPTIVGDFDEITTHFSDSKVLFPIKDIAKGKYNKEELRFFQNLIGEDFNIMSVENTEFKDIEQLQYVKGDNSGSLTQNQQKNLSQPIDFDILLPALSQLILALDAKQNKSTEERIAIGEVAQAEKAAQEKDESKVVKHLKSAGTWVLDTAKDIGVDIVTDLIKKQAGI